MRVTARCVWPAGALLGEGPVWRPAERALYGVDILERRVWRWRPDDGSLASTEFPDTVGSLVPRRAGGWVAGIGTRLARIELARGGFETLAEPEPDQPGNRFNDGKCDAAGRLWAGTMDRACERPSGALYRVEPDGTTARVDAGYVVTNGPAFAPDGATLYHSDSLRGIVHAFDLDLATGTLEGKRVFARLALDAGYPDGMAVDAEGCLWIARFGGWRLTRLDPAGRIERELRLPVANVTSCCFGGPELERLYVTTAREGLSASQLREQPLAGGLFELEPGVRGLPAQEFAG
jgi:sugar lactone lactonase YvrE